MAVVQGIRERVHLPIYDSLHVEPEEQFRKKGPSSVLKFFVDVQGKTKLETNLQSASLLPHYNTFEARAMRVVISDLAPEFPDDVDVELEGNSKNDFTGTPPDKFTVSLKRAMELLTEARDSEEGFAETSIASGEEVDTGGVATFIRTGDIEGGITDLDNSAPPPEQVSPGNGAGSLMSRLVYNTVTTLYVGEKVMISMPTWFFPGGAGPFSETGKFTTHGEPNPTATFRFAEPIFIDKQQNFRVEIEVPDSDQLKEIQKIYGPLFVVVVLDGYMVRDVQ